MSLSKNEALKEMFDGKTVKHLESGALYRVANYGVSTSQVLSMDQYNKLPEGTYEIIEGGREQ